MKTIQERLRALREDNDLKQANIAELLGTTQQQYSKYETGESELPLRALSILADRYNVSADFIMGRTERKKEIDAWNNANITSEAIMSDILSLSIDSRNFIIECISLRKLKESCTCKIVK